MFSKVLLSPSFSLKLCSLPSRLRVMVYSSVSGPSFLLFSTAMVTVREPVLSLFCTVSTPSTSEGSVLTIQLKIWFQKLPSSLIWMVGSPSFSLTVTVQVCSEAT